MLLRLKVLAFDCAFNPSDSHNDFARTAAKSAHEHVNVNTSAGGIRPLLTLVLMAYRDLREFVSALEQQGELKRILLEVDPILEITAFADRAVKTGGPALLFERPKGSNVPVLINAFASMRRMQLALQVDSVEEVAGRI